MIIFVCLGMVLGVIFAVCCCYQMVFLFIRLFTKKKELPEAQKLCRYAVLIAARNEGAVIGHLIDSIKGQDYPSELIEVFVAADNCTDDTARVAREHGAAAYERFDTENIGKGYVLDFLFSKIEEKKFDGYFIIDADNLLSPDFVSQMNKVFSSGSRIVTSYRNTKNFGKNWLTAGYGLYFIRESEFLNRPRDYLNTGCILSGTGFLVADSLIRENGGWNCFLLTEDLEFSSDMIIKGEKAAYCGEAEIYDEQPEGFIDSLVQRSRWIKGYFQIMKKSGIALFTTFLKEKRFACYDMLMNIHLVTLTFISLILNVAGLAYTAVFERHNFLLMLSFLVLGVAGLYFIFFIFSLVTTVTEWNRINCPGYKKILYIFTFPVFIFSFSLSMIAAMFLKIKWEPIKHVAAVSVDEVMCDAKNQKKE